MTLSLTVHRGTFQIGGTCIEIAHDSGARLLLDAGRPLDAARDAQELLPASLDTSSPATILICHAYQDHWGLLHEMPADWPVWTGPISERLIRLGLAMNGQALDLSVRTWAYQRPFTIGPFTVTAWLTDHSAPDAAMLLIKADGQRIFYTGDFRAHGRKAKLVKALMANPPADIDILIIEGTNLGSNKPTVSETEVEEKLVDLLDQVTGRVFVYWSAQNVDRTTSLFRAVRRRRRKLFVDLYSAEVMDRVGPGTRLPRVIADFAEMQLMVTKSQTGVRNKTEEIRKATDDLINRCKASGQAISARQLPRDAVLMVRDSSLRDFDGAGIHPGTDDAFVFSSWTGYADTIAAKTFALMRQSGVRIEYIHTSGHASPSDLTAFMRAFSPKQIVPVHGEKWDLPHDGFPDLLRLADGQTYRLPGGSSAVPASPGISP